jgi:deferrochelatase/peroxidase EfeB
MSLELDDIQHFLLTRPHAMAARYEFLSFPSADRGRAWLSTILEKVGSGATVNASDPSTRWVTVAFTWNGLRALGVEEPDLATFPEEFRQGMAARAAVLGLTGANAPEHWVGGLADFDLHAIVILFAKDVTERERCREEHARFVEQCGVRVISSLDLAAIPPLEYAHEHFGYRDRLSQPVIEGTGEIPTPGSGPAIAAGEVFIGYPDVTGLVPATPKPDVLSKNGSYLAYLQMQEHVGRFRDFLKEHGGGTKDGEELLAAKLMGRWRSGAPLVLAPTKDDPELGADKQRNNDFNYGQMDPLGYACPVGSHVRRMNPRDTAHHMERRKMVRRGGTYGPHLPDDAPEDGVERGIASFLGGSSLVRQFEFTMNVWTNDPRFSELNNERDPIIGTQDGSYDMTIPKRPIKRTIRGLPSFTTIRGGAYFFLPGMRALRHLAGEPATTPATQPATIAATGVTDTESGHV